MRGAHRWNSLGWLLCAGMLSAQLPARYVLKADALGFLWKEHRVWGEYRLFQWAPPFIASVDRHPWDGLTAVLGMSYFRKLPLRGAIVRAGARYYPLRPVYSPQGFWVGLHIATAIWNARREKISLGAAPGVTIGYQHIFRQAYGGSVEPYLLIEPYMFQKAPIRPIQIGINAGFASRRWGRATLR